MGFPRKGTDPRPKPLADGRAYAEQRIIDRQDQYARDELSMEDLEDAIHFWLKVAECDYCSGQGMCNGHYDYWYSYGEQ